MMKRLFSLVALLLGLSLSASAQAQSKLPPCPAVDYSKKTHTGVGGRTEKWHKCYGRYIFELNDVWKGVVYEGEYRNGIPNGQGKYTFASGEKYEGEIKDDMRNGLGTSILSNGEKYVGEWKFDKPSGHGTYTYPDGDKFVGEFKDGKRNGQGTFTVANGAKYVGEWKDDKGNGQGTLTLANGDKYVGEFKDGNFNGQGTLTLANGDKYVGNHKDGKRSGLGIYTFTDGPVQEGIWADGKFVRTEKVNLPLINQQTDVSINEERIKLDSDRHAQSKLPPCPDVDYSKSTHPERLAKWTNCYGRYTFEISEGTKASVYEGEFKGGKKHGKGTYIYNGGKYVGEYKDGKMHGQGTHADIIGGVYKGDFKDGMYNGQGTYTNSNGDMYVGEFKHSYFNGRGIQTYAFGGPAKEGIWADGKFVRADKVNSPPINQQNNVAINEERRRLDADRQVLEQERQRLTEDRNRREQAKQTSKLSLQTTTTNPDANGVVIISVRTNADTSSLKVNGEEQGGRPDGNYTIKRVARVGQDTQFTITATDINGNTDSKTIAVSRKTVESVAVTASLNPENIKSKFTRDAVAIIIGISNYKSLPRADFAKDDAQVFYDYAIRALGVKPENIKLLLDSDAEEVEIFKAFKTWLPARVKSTTDVYVFYSGHGLPTSDGLGLYLLPYRADRDLISKTAVQFQEINVDIQAAKPKSVTIFMDACYSGQARGGETLIASARPLALKVQASIFPSSFTVFSASQSDQISSSSPDLKHGLFSYYLMKGMEGDADANKDGKITLGEMQGYLTENVGRQAGMMNRKQEPQLIGDPTRVLVGR